MNNNPYKQDQFLHEIFNLVVAKNNSPQNTLFIKFYTK